MTASNLPVRITHFLNCVFTAESYARDNSDYHRAKAACWLQGAVAAYGQMTPEERLVARTEHERLLGREWEVDCG